MHLSTSHFDDKLGALVCALFIARALRVIYESVWFSLALKCLALAR